MGRRLAEPCAVGRVVQPAACAGRVGEGDRERIAQQEALADRLSEPTHAQEVRRRCQPDRDDQRRVEEPQLIVPPRLTERFLCARRSTVSSSRRAGAWEAAGDRGAVERREEGLLVEPQPSAQRAPRASLPGASRLRLDPPWRKPEEVGALPAVPREDRRRDDREAGFEAPAAPCVPALDLRQLRGRGRPAHRS